MLLGVERLVDLSGLRQNAMTASSAARVAESVRVGDVAALGHSDGHFAAAGRDGQTVRLARTIGAPLRYFVAKMFHGPFLVVSDRIDTIFEWCQAEKIGWQFDPLYTRMVPAHYLVEIDQIGCPDPAPRYRRFFNTPIAQGPKDIQTLGAAYIEGAKAGLIRWLEAVPPREPIALAFSGGIDSTSVWLLARHVLQEMSRDPDQVRAFTLDLGGGEDAAQAETVARDLGLAECWESIRIPADQVDLEAAIAVIEDYHPLDVECAAVAFCLLRGIRDRYPSLRYLLDGDGGDENLKDYPLEDSDLTLSSVLRNPLLYQEGWGVDAIKHSLTYSGGLSRAYVRTYAPGRHFGFDAFSPYTDRAAMAAALAVPFEQVVDGSVENLYGLKAQMVHAGVRAVTGIDMPTPPKRRFQDGTGGDIQGAGGDSYRKWRVSKAWCRQAFLRQWSERLRAAWDPQADRFSGNDLSRPFPATR